MTRVDRDKILDLTDLPALADELLGPRRGRGAWLCPTHSPQTGRTPPVSIYTTPRGEQRWHCHSCGTGGTAIDLLIATCDMNVRDALEALATRTALHPHRPIPRATPPAAPSDAGRTLVQHHVERCARMLWTDPGRSTREWLHARGLTDETLRAHHIGADPGPRTLDRPRGLPRSGPAAIFPVTDHDDIVYFQARYLQPEHAGGRKYDNPIAALAPNPRLAIFDPPGDTRSETVFVCEGIPDALSVSQAGHHAVAVLGVGLAGPQIAQRLHAELPDRPLRIAFDADARGVMARDALIDELEELGCCDAHALTLPEGVHDLNTWLLADAAGLAERLDIAASPATAPEIDVGLSL